MVCFFPYQSFSFALYFSIDFIFLKYYNNRVLYSLRASLEKIAWKEKKTNQRSDILRLANSSKFLNVLPSTNRF